MAENSAARLYSIGLALLYLFFILALLALMVLSLSEWVTLLLPKLASLPWWPGEPELREEMKGVAWRIFLFLCLALGFVVWMKDRRKPPA